MSDHHAGHHMHGGDAMASGAAAEHAGHGAHGAQHHAHMIADFRRRFFVCLAATVPVLALSPLIQKLLGLQQSLHFAGDIYVSLALSSIIYVYGGWPFLAGWVAEVRARQPGMMTLIGVAISVAYVYSVAVVAGLRGGAFFWETATLIDIMLLGHWIEMRSVMGASGALDALVRLLPATAHRLGDGGAIDDVPVAQLRSGDHVLVRPGERIPVDGVILDGRSSVNESMLTGESRPVDREPDQPVIGGSVNGEGALTVRIERTGDATYLSQVIAMVRAAQQSRSRTQDLANRAAAWLTWIAIGSGSLTLAIWLAVGRDLAFALERMVTVMVICCPHALGLAVPLVIAVSTSLTARNGLLVRNRAAFERARNLQAVVFDKTGTLTEGAFGVTDVVPLADNAVDRVLALAASLESRSEHPIARAIVAEAARRGFDLLPVSDFENMTGQGARATVDGQRVRIVSPSTVRADGGNLPPQVDALTEEGKTVVIVLVNDAAAGVMALADRVRPESAAAIAELKAMGLRCMMLTGDTRGVARSVGQQLGLDEQFAEVLPHQKAEKIREVRARGLNVAMVGDGVNDAPALVEADLGIAIGAGTEVAVEAADIVLVRSDPRDVAAVIGLARATYRKMVQNLIWATAYNAVALPLAAGVLYSAGIVLSPAAGAALMSVSTVIVAINAKLLDRSGRRAVRHPVRPS